MPSVVHLPHTKSSLTVPKSSANSGVNHHGAPYSRILLPRHPIALLLLLTSMVLALGFWTSRNAAITANELQVDQDLSRSHNAMLTGAAMFLNGVFSPLGGVVIIASICLILLVLRKMPVEAILFGAVASSGWLSAQVFKIIVERHRPNPALLANPLAPETGSDSFPSGHVALVVGLGWAFCVLLRRTRWSRFAAIAGLTIGIVVGGSRVYLGVHYPSDVLGAVIAATSGALFLVMLWKRWAEGLVTKTDFLKLLSGSRKSAANSENPFSGK